MKRIALLMGMLAITAGSAMAQTKTASAPQAGMIVFTSTDGKVHETTVAKASGLLGYRLSREGVVEKGIAKVGTRVVEAVRANVPKMVDQDQFRDGGGTKPQAAVLPGVVLPEAGTAGTVSWSACGRSG